MLKYLAFPFKIILQSTFYAIHNSSYTEKLFTHLKQNQYQKSWLSLVSHNAGDMYTPRHRLVSFSIHFLSQLFIRESSSRRFCSRQVDNFVVFYVSKKIKIFETSLPPIKREGSFFRLHSIHSVIRTGDCFLDYRLFLQ